LESPCKFFLTVANNTMNGLAVQNRLVPIKLVWYLQSKELGIRSILVNDNSFEQSVMEPKTLGGWTALSTQRQIYFYNFELKFR